MGTVVSKNPHRTIIVEWDRTKKVQKYERYEKMRTKIAAHNPTCINAGKGDRVVLHECRPLSKTKSFVVTKVVGTDIEYLEKEQRLVEEMAKTEGKKVEEAEAPKEEQ